MYQPLKPRLVLRQRKGSVHLVRNLLCNCLIIHLSIPASQNGIITMGSSFYSAFKKGTQAVFSFYWEGTVGFVWSLIYRSS